jgi:hypothetical protein
MLSVKLLQFLALTAQVDFGETLRLSMPGTELNILMHPDLLSKEPQTST